MRYMTTGAAIGLMLLASVMSVVPAFPQVVSDDPPQDSLVTALEMMASEMELAQIAQDKSSHSKVRALANDIIKDHKRAIKRLKEVPGAPWWEVWSSDQRHAASDRLYDLSGSEFDLEFLNQTVDAYQESLGFFEAQSRARNRTFAKIARDVKTRALDELLVAEALRHALAVTTLGEKG